MGSLLVWLFLKSNDIIAISFIIRKGKWELGAKPQKIFGTTPFQSQEIALFDIKIALQKRQCRQMMFHIPAQIPVSKESQNAQIYGKTAQNLPTLQVLRVPPINLSVGFRVAFIHNMKLQ